MAETIKCPVCGEVNPADVEFCQNCQSRLQPLTGPLKGEDAPLTPGQVPTKKTTSELEPILPQWLREARQQARQSAEEEETKKEEEQKTTPIPRAPDLLAGLASQNETEDEETPDWLTNITGIPSKRKKIEPEDAQVKFVELRHEEPAETSSDQATKEPEQSGLPAWMAGQEAAPEKDELAEWFAQASGSAADGSAAPVQPAPSQPEPSQSLDSNVADWLKDLDEHTASALAPAQTAPSSDIETPDWLKNLDSSAPPVEQKDVEPAPSSNVEIPDWLKDLDKSAPVIEKAPAQSQPEISSKVETPDWLKNLDANATTIEQPSAQNVPVERHPVETPLIRETAETKSEIPDRLQAADASSETPPEAKPESEEAASTGLPDWLASLKPGESQPSESNQSESVFTSEEPAAPESSDASAFTRESLLSSDAGDVFGAMELPDWLTSAAATGQPSAGENPPSAAGEEIAPAELPSWVQAMRPVEAAMPEPSAPASEGAVESSGPLAGLQGVLPAIPGAVVPSSKPKSHSIKLNATAEQQAQAALLEKILGAETAPIPMKASSVVTSQRVLRWALSAILLIVLGGVVFGRTQIFPLPSQVPNETSAAMRAVSAIPDGAPVLAVFDYQPSTVGEMEATGSSLMNQLLLLKHPRLAIVSTSPTGAALAERFMSDALAARNYQRGTQYVDLGYLPGGLTGVYAFAQNPMAAMPLGADRSAVWQSAPLQGVTHLSDFAAVIVLTDSVDSGRTWIEQTALERGALPMIIVSSAQAGPMFLPYVDSGQIVGLVSGLSGAAGVEQANGGLPGFVRRYWDAYSVGSLIAVALIVLGGLWNLILGLQARRAQGTR